MNPHSSTLTVSDQPKIKLRRFKHRNHNQIGLVFPFNQEIKLHLLKLDFVRWTKTHGCFYIPDGSRELDALISHCRGKVWVQLSDLKANKKPAKEFKVKLDEQVRQRTPRIQSLDAAEEISGHHHSNLS